MCLWRKDENQPAHVGNLRGSRDALLGRQMLNASAHSWESAASAAEPKLPAAQILASGINLDFSGSIVPLLLFWVITYIYQCSWECELFSPPFRNLGFSPLHRKGSWGPNSWSNWLKVTPCIRETTKIKWYQIFCLFYYSSVWLPSHSTGRRRCKDSLHIASSAPSSTTGGGVNYVAGTVLCFRTGAGKPWLSDRQHAACFI